MQKYVIALYIRLSLEDYKYDSMSIENQHLALNEFVSSMPESANAEVLEFIDNGYSGTNFERPKVQELIEMVRANKIDCIIVKDDCVIKARTPQTLENRHFLRIGTEFRAIQRPQRAAYHIETS